MNEERIFAEALRLPLEERTAYLAQATQGNAELRLPNWNITLLIYFSPEFRFL